MDARGLRGPHRRPARHRRGAPRDRSGCTHVIHLAAIVGGIGNFHKLPAHADRGEQRALQRRLPRGARPTTSSGSSTCRRSMVFERATEFPTTEEHLRDTPIPQSAYGFSKLTGEVYCRAAARRARPAVHDLPPVQRLRPGRDARGRAGHRAHGPRRDQEVPGAAEARRCRSSAPASRRARSRTSTTSPTASSSRWPADAGLERGLQHLGRRGADRRRDRAGHLGGARPRPRGVRAGAPADASRSTSSAAGRPSRRPSGCSAGRRRSACAKGSARRRTGCAASSPPPESVCEAVVRVAQRTWHLSRSDVARASPSAR